MLHDLINNQLADNTTNNNDIDITTLKLINPHYNNESNITYIHMLNKMLKQHIYNVSKIAKEHTIDTFSIADKYLTCLSRLHFLIYSLKNLWDNNIKEYNAYRDYFQNLRAVKFVVYEANDLFLSLLEPVDNQFADCSEINFTTNLNNLYNILDKLCELNKDIEAKFAGVDSSIYVE